MNNWFDFAAFSQNAFGAAIQQAPLGFIDIGARGGVHPLVEPIAGSTQVLAFEADAEECSRLQKLLHGNTQWAHIDLAPIALGASEADAELHLLSTETNHSLLPPDNEFTHRYNMEKWREIETVPVKTRSLDSIVYGDYPNNQYYGEFIKLDTQGTEYEILLGAERTLRERCVAVVSEVAFFPIYKGQRLFSDVESLLRKQGFSFYGFTDMAYRSKRLIDKTKQKSNERIFYADAVFFKDPLPGGGRRISLNDRQKMVLILCAMLLSYYDFALELLDALEDENHTKKIMKSFILDVCRCDPKELTQQVESLLERMKSNETNAMIELGDFVDKAYSNSNYNEFSPQP
ncbi:MAG: FkbM family methyltransferase [Candidatus Hinthialibacter antarcticus]|nr:FkbM family methyltransferase [Candidatus Hinthialibacter antarcticus]